MLVFESVVVFEPVFVFEFVWGQRLAVSGSPCAARRETTPPAEGPQPTTRRSHGHEHEHGLEDEHEHDSRSGGLQQLAIHCIGVNRQVSAAGSKTNAVRLNARTPRRQGRTI